MAQANPASPWNTSSLEPPLVDEFLAAQRMGLVNLGTYNPASRLPSGGLSDHARYPSRAFDVGGPPAKLDSFFKAMINRPGIEYVIYRDKIWSRSRGLHSYSHGGHETHVHVSGTASPRPASPPVVPGQQQKPSGGYKGPLADVPVVGPAGRAATRGLDWVLSPVDQAVGVAKAPFDAIKWVGGNWDRVLEVAAGFILVLVGLVLMGRAVGLGGLGKKTPIGRAASFATGGTVDPVEAAYAKGEEDYLRLEARRAGRRAAAARAPTSQNAQGIPY